MSSKVQVILNPMAGYGSGARLEGQIADHLRAAGVDFDMALTQAPGHATELAQRFGRNGFSAIVAAGGDGTVNEVVNGLARAGKAEEGHTVGPLGVIPIGTGNDLADMSGIPRDLSAACQRIAHGHLTTIDIARVNDRYFDNSCGVGFEAQVAIEVGRLKRLRGYLAYLVAVFGAMLHFQQPEMTVHWDDGEARRRLLLVSLGNSRRSGGGFYLTPEARLDDGLLDFTYADRMSRLGILRLLPKVMKGTHTRDAGIHTGRTRRLRIECEHPVPVHADGELVTSGTCQVEVSILPARLRLLT